MFCGDESRLTVLADVDWNDTDMPLSSEPTLPRRCGFSPLTATIEILIIKKKNYQNKCKN
jgi:hypothetical protein